MTSVVRITLAFPEYVSTLILYEGPREYMYWGMVERADREMRLSLQPVSYWIPIFVPPRFKVSTKGTDWLALTLGTVTKCLAVHARPFVHSDSMLQASLETHSGGSVCESKLTLITTAMSLMISGQLSLPVPQCLLREK